MGYRGRDVEIISLENEKCIIMACDSAGGIGDKVLDAVKITPDVVGALTARVALMEILAVGGVPSMLAATICCEPEPTGQKILNGIYNEMTSANIKDVKVTISTEKNIKTSQTGIGVTIVGICDSKELRIGNTKLGDDVYCMGIPKVGNEILEGEGEIAKTADIIILRQIDGVKDIIPVGSGGILKEAKLMANIVGCKFKAIEDEGIDFNKSSGPSTCVIFSYESGAELSEVIGLRLPIKKIGTIY